VLELHSFFFKGDLEKEIGIPVGKSDSEKKKKIAKKSDTQKQKKCQRKRNRHSSPTIQIFHLATSFPSPNKSLAFGFSTRAVSR
jgi:hypothetical protein